MLRLGWFGGLLASILFAAAPVRAREVEVVALTGDRAPFTPPGVVFTEFVQDVLLDEAGRLLFGATVDGPGVDGSSDSGLWRGAPDSIVLVAREGDAAVDVASSSYASAFAAVGQTESGGFAFRALTWPSLAGSAAWLHDETQLGLLRRPGQPAVGTPGGVVFDDIFTIGIGETATAVLWAGLTGSGVTGANDTGLWKRDATSFSLLARAGAAAPGVAPPDTMAVFQQPAVGDAFTRFRAPHVDAAGRIAFDAELDAGPNARAILAERPAGLAVLARDGMIAPCIDGAAILLYPYALRASAGDAIAFSAEIGGAGIQDDEDQVLYRDLGSGPEVLLREGERAGTIIVTPPGGLPGLQAVDFGPYFEAAISDGGRVAVEAIVVGTEVADQRWLFWIGRDGLRQRLLRTGETLEVAQGDERGVAFFHVAGISPPRVTGTGSGVNEQRVAAWVSFTDGSEGILLVPEPAHGALAAVLALAVAARARSGARRMPRIVAFIAARASGSFRSGPSAAHR